jgi:hypothetical protein
MEMVGTWHDRQLAAVLAYSNKRYLPEHYLTGDRAQFPEDFARLKLRAAQR